MATVGTTKKRGKTRFRIRYNLYRRDGTSIPKEKLADSKIRGVRWVEERNFLKAYATNPTTGKRSISLGLAGSTQPAGLTVRFV